GNIKKMPQKDNDTTMEDMKAATYRQCQNNGSLANGMCSYKSCNLPTMSEQWKPCKRDVFI
ncbi:hypothetical protein, partial [Escherichia coli]|uniref:hypothetical protein n=1 Tax=Escherichia coli TaxID=562 RepID=UPI0019589AFF